MALERRHPHLSGLSRRGDMRWRLELCDKEPADTGVDGAAPETEPNPVTAASLSDPVQWGSSAHTHTS